MCGIVGLVDKDNFHLLSKMNNILFHRGPDDSGEFVDKERCFAFAMRRLAIIDIEGGKQPMSNEDNSLWVICNGEIYNSPELRNYMIKKGHIFKTKNSDVEVLLHLYEEKGSQLLEDLNGMFAFVIYDKNKGILFGARDRIGIKPFYFSYKNGKFAFSSEMKSLLILPWISKEINPESLYHYISLQFVPAPQSIFIDIKKLPAGHYFIYDLNKKEITINKYWELNVSEIENKSVDEWEELIIQKLKESVKRWTLSDVPIACSLSGGLDSSTIVGILASEGFSDLRTYSLGFEGIEEQEFNELPLAIKVAEKWNTEHHEIFIDAKRILNDLEKMVWHLDEPYAGGLPSWYIYEIIGRNVKVAMTGTGGDELFGNYGKFKIYERGFWYKPLKVIQNIIRNHNWDEIKNALNYPKGYFYWKYFSDAMKDNIIFNGLSPKCKTEAYIDNIWHESGTKNPRNAVAYIDFKLQLPEEFLYVTDRFSMAHSVEARVPFLDHELVELVFKMPPVVRTGWSEPKSFFKSIIKNLLPEELWNAPKRGFILPLTVWTRNDLKSLIKENLSPDYLKKQGIFSEKVYDKIISPHLEGKKDYTQQVWTLLMFQMWYKKYVLGG